MTHDSYRTVFKSLIGLLLGLVVVATVIVKGPEMESTYLPVSKDWTPAVVERDGADLLVAGTLVKERACMYVPPPRARDHDGRNPAVVSASPTALQSWAPDENAQQFGPWRIIGGAGKRVLFFQEHRCHPLWTTFTVLGEVETSP